MCNSTGQKTKLNTGSLVWFDESKTTNAMGSIFRGLEPERHVCKLWDTAHHRFDTSRRRVLSFPSGRASWASKSRRRRLTTGISDLGMSDRACCLLIARNSKSTSNCGFGWCLMYDYASGRVDIGEFSVPSGDSGTAYQTCLCIL